MSKPQNPLWQTTKTERKSYYSYFFGQNMIYNMIAGYLATFLLLIGVNPVKSAMVMLIVKVWDAVNDAIRSGHWNASTPMTNPAVSAPESPEIVKPSTQPMPIAEPEAKPNVTVNAPGRQPTVTRTQEGNTTRVVVRF